MRSAEQLPEEDSGEPPSLESHENYFDLLLGAHDRLEIFPPYPTDSNKSGEFTFCLFDDYDTIGIEASLSGDLVEKYQRLDSEGRYQLADYIETAIGRAVIEVYGDSAEEVSENDTSVLINNLPVIFEPINNAMLVGNWDDWEKRKMTITSQYIEDYDQQRLLLGALAAFLTYLEQQ